MSRPQRLDVARTLAVASLALTFAALGVVVVGASQSSTDRAADRLEPATAAVWPRLMALSEELDALEPGASRTRARSAARDAARALAAARRSVPRLDVPVAATPVLASTETALRASAGWVDAVGSVLANPRSPRRADLAVLARDAAQAVSRLSGHVPTSQDSVAGTGHLLSATR